MAYYGNIDISGALSFCFTTRASTGIPTVLAGSPVISIFKAGIASGSKTSAESYISLTIDLNSVVGLNAVILVLDSNVEFFNNADFQVVITTGTVDGVSVVGEVVGEFSVGQINQEQRIQSGGINVPPKASPAGFVVTSGESESNSEDSVHVPDGTLHQIEAVLDSTQKIDVYYEFATSITAIPISFTAKHKLLPGASTTDGEELTILAYDFGNTQWDVIGEIQGGRDLTYDTFALYARHIEVGIGTVRIRYNTGTTAPQSDTLLQVDHAFVSYVDPGPVVTSVGSGAVNYEASQDNSGGTIDPGSTVFVGFESNNYTDTALANGTYHIISDNANVIDVVYGFNVTGNAQATLMEFTGFANANNDDLTVQVWNHSGAAWETLGTLEGKVSTTDDALSFSLLSRHTGTSIAEIGKVYIRFVGSSLSSNADLNTNQILIGAVTSASAAVTPGYAVGSIWVDTNASNTNAVAYVDGLADNPVNSWANALAVSAATNITDFHILNGSSIQLSGVSTNFSLFGNNWVLDLNGQSCVGIHIEGAAVSGAMAGTGTDQTFDHCHMGVTSLIKGCHFIECTIEATQTLIEAGDVFYEECASGVAGGDTWSFSFGSVGSSNLHMRNYSGGVQLEAMGDNGTDIATIEGQGQIIEGTCTGGTVTVRGAFTVSGFTNLTLSDEARLDMPQINAECDAAIETYGLDHLLAASVTGTDVTNDSIFAKLASKAVVADWDTFNNTTESLEALRDFFESSIIPEVGVVTSSTLVTGTYIAAATDDVRRYTDEPSVNAKWNDADILAKLNEAWAEIYIDITFNAVWPVIVKYNISYADGQSAVILPPNVGQMMEVVKLSDDGQRLVIWEYAHRSFYDPSGWGIRITGNTLELGSNWTGASEVMQMSYIPNGEVAPLDGKWENSEDFSSDLRTITLPTSAVNGNLPTLPNSLAGCMFRTIIPAGTTPVAGDPTTIQQEQFITAYDPVTRVCTLATDQDPPIILGGGDTLTFEIVPLLHSLLRGIVAVRAAQNILSAEGNKDRAQMLALEYRRKLRSLKLQVASIKGREATKFEGGTRDDPRSRHNRWGF